ncbi:MAG: hypothetical protein ACR2MG_03880 [Pyrinomonadaceae bacterium]
MSGTNITYNFNEFAENSFWRNIQYPYANFYCYNTYLRVSSVVSAYLSYPKFVGCDYPRWLDGVGVKFTEPVHNLSFSVVGGDGGTFKVDLYKNNQFSQTLTFPASCGGYAACFVDLRTHTNVTGVDMHTISDPLGVGFDDFSFAIGQPPPTTRSPIGYLDGVNLQQAAAVGWSVDPDNTSASNNVDCYVDNNFIGRVLANNLSPDVPYPGNHRFAMPIPTQYRNGSQHQINCYGLDVTGGDSPTLLMGSPATFTLGPAVQSVVFASITNEVINNELTNSEIDRPTSGYNSQRIFPDRKYPEDTTNHKQVRVKAIVGRPNVMVYFKNFDVDDPSDDPDIDENGSIGNDNREGRIIGQPYPPTAAGVLSTASALTNANGEAIVYFTVTKQPGDNFVVAASTNETYLNGVAINGTGLKDSANTALPTTQAKRTELLTVWRKVHIEIDSMGEVKDNFVTGYFAGKGTYIGAEPKWIEIYSSTIFEVHTYEDTLADNGTYSYGGRMDIAGVHSLQVLDSEPFGIAVNNIPSRQKLLVKSLNGNIYLRPNHPFKLYDDDDFNSNDGSQKDGDNGENVDYLFDTLSHMQTSDNVDANAYAAAYIKPEYQWAQERGLNDSNVPFVLNTPCSLQNCDAGLVSINENRGSKTMERDDFWIGYLLVSYQADELFDVDPTGFLGGVALSDYQRLDVSDKYDQFYTVLRGKTGAIIFIEAMRDFDFKPPPIVPSPIAFKTSLARTRVAPHELGHQFGLAGDTEKGYGIMSYDEPLNFVSAHINLMRWRIKSPGEGGQ